MSKIVVDYGNSASGGINGANGFFACPRTDKIHLYLCDANGVTDVSSIDNDFFTVSGISSLSITYKKAGTIIKMNGSGTITESTVAANDTETVTTSGSANQLTAARFYKTYS